MYTFLIVLSTIAFIVGCLIVVVKLDLSGDIGPSGTDVVLLLCGVLLIAFASMVFFSREKTVRLGVIAEYDIEYIKESVEPNKIVYGYAGERFVVSVDDNADSKIDIIAIAAGELRYQKIREVEYPYVKIFGKTVSEDSPSVKTIHCFYVPKSYLDEDSSHDWSLLFEEE